MNGDGRQLSRLFLHLGFGSLFHSEEKRLDHRAPPFVCCHIITIITAAVMASETAGSQRASIFSPHRKGSNDQKEYPDEAATLSK